MYAFPGRPVFEFEPPKRGERDPLSDVRVCIVGASEGSATEYDCHRHLLACACSHFKQLFRLFPDERRFEFQTFGAKEFETLLNALYCRHNLPESVSRVCETTESFLSHFRMFEYLGCDVLLTACANNVSVVVAREVSRFVRGEPCLADELHALCERHALGVLPHDHAGTLQPLRNALSHKLIQTIKDEFMNVLHARETCDDRSVTNFRRLLALPFVKFEEVVHPDSSIFFKIASALHWCDDERKLVATREFMSQFWLWNREDEKDARSGGVHRGCRYLPTDTLSCLRWHVKTNAWMFARTNQQLHPRFCPVRVRITVVTSDQEVDGPSAARVSLELKYSGCLPAFWATADGMRCFSEFLINAHISETMQ